MPAPARFRLVSSPPGGQAAISVIEVSAPTAPALDAALARAGITSVTLNQWALRSLGPPPGADRGVVARVSPTTVWLMPHAGPAVMSELLSNLAAAGLTPLDEPNYPEAASEIEARMLATLAMAPSPLAIDLLLEQPHRWIGLDPLETVARADAPTRRRWRILHRLLEPPIVAAWGAPNIGKSSLLNALAGAPVALAADERGTTRDHVGAALELAGLVVWYADTPGVHESTSTPDDLAAQADAAAREVAARADLLLLCADHTTTVLTPPFPAANTLRIALRADLGPPPDHPRVDAAISLAGPDSAAQVRALATLIRDRLVPPDALSHPGPWPFWETPSTPRA